MAAYTTINNPGAYFSVVKWSGDGTSPRTISGVGFQPGLTILKARDSAQYWYTYDSVRGAGVSSELHLDMTEAEGAAGGTTGYLSAFNSDGFVVTAGTSNDNVTNDGALTYCSWNWKEDATSGFDILIYTGTGSAHTISHNLSAVPHLMIHKGRTDAYSWITYHHKNTDAPETDHLTIESSSATADSVYEWNDTAPTSSVWTVGSGSGSNENTKTYVSYLWSEKQGYSKFSNFLGNGNADGQFIYMGFRPAMVIFKKTSGSNVWMLMDNQRSPSNPCKEYLKPSLANAENNDEDVCDFLSNGVKLRASNGKYNESGSTYVYIAFAEAPLVNSNGVPCNAR